MNKIRFILSFLVILSLTAVSLVFAGGTESQERTIPWKSFKTTEGQVKVVILVKRNPSLTPQEFHALYNNHANTFRANQHTNKYISRYVQNHTPIEAYAKGEPGIDGITELWFDSRADHKKFYEDKEFRQNLFDRLAKFTDMKNSPLYVMEEVLVADKHTGN